MRQWDPNANGDMDVPDPYYGGMDGFEHTYHIVARSVEGLLEELAEAHQ
jgi:protein-tyrosine phosphatase